MKIKADEGKLISGKEALIALADGQDVQVRFKTMPDNGWFSVDTTKIQSIDKILNGGDDFRLKPRTITINGIEVPAPFEPKPGELYYHPCGYRECGYWFNTNDGFDYLGAWRTEEEIKQVVATLRQAFGGSHDN